MFFLYSSRYTGGCPTKTRNLDKKKNYMLLNMCTRLSGARNANALLVHVVDDK